MVPDVGFVPWNTDEENVQFVLLNAFSALDPPLGPDYLPGHAHADTLSFELSLFGRRVLVNSGTSEYGTGPERLRQRGTPAHNTVTINDADSSEVWGGFGVGRRARPLGLWVGNSDHTMKVSCSHDGYSRLSGRPVHRRLWHFSPGELKVTDTIEGYFNRARARFHFHPDVHVQAAADGIEARLGGGQQIKLGIGGGGAAIISTTWHPQFGLSQANQCLEVVFRGPRIETVFSW